MQAFFLLLLSGTLAAGVFITGKQAGSEQLSPLAVLFWQMAGGALVVWLISWPTRAFPRWSWLHLRYYLIGGLLGISLPYLLAFKVMHELQVGTVGLLTALSPVFTYAMARLMRLDTGHPLRFLGLLMGLVGVILLIAPQGPSGLDIQWLNSLMALGIPVSLAAGNIYRSRYWPSNSEAIPLVSGMLSVQAVVLLMFNLLTNGLHPVVPVSTDAVLVLLMLGLLAGSSYLSSFRLLKIGGPVYLSQMGYVITAVTVLTGILLWDEFYDLQDMLGMGVVFLGVMLTTMASHITRLGAALSSKISQKLIHTHI